jgi:lysophospholipase L1-like esterase
MILRGIVVIIAFLLAGATLASIVLFREAREYYEELNYVRLDPYGVITSSGTAVPTRHPELPLILMVGDSRIFDWSLPSNAPYQFVQWGLGGQTTEQVLGRYRQQIGSVTPDVVIIQAGINDLKAIPLFPHDRDLIVARCKENLYQIAQLSLETGARVVLTTIIPTGAVPLQRQFVWSDEVAPAIVEVNEYLRSLVQDRIEVMDAYEFLADDAGLLRSEYSDDFLHISEAGYSILNERLMPLIQTNVQQE